jgi:hypothetical protein
MKKWLSETCREYKETYIKKNFASSWLFTKMGLQYENKFLRNFMVGGM